MRQEAKTSCLKRLNRISEARCAGSPAWSRRPLLHRHRHPDFGGAGGFALEAEEEILEDHVGHCVEHAIASGNKREQRRKISELIDVLSRSDR